MTDKQPEALRLAKILEDHYFYSDTNEAAAELRRLHTENAEQIGEIVALKEQRDELLEALRRIAMAAEAAVCNVEWIAHHARDAIAKAGGAT